MSMSFEIDILVPFHMSPSRQCPIWINILICSFQQSYSNNIDNQHIYISKLGHTSLCLSVLISLAVEPNSSIHM